MTEDDSKAITGKLRNLLGDEADTVENELNDFYQWMLKKGKNIDKKEKLSSSLSENYHSRIDQIFRFIIERTQNSEKTTLTTTEADLIIKWLEDDKIQKQSGDPYSETSKRKFSNAMKKYFAWRHYEDSEVSEWEPQTSFSDGEHEHADRLNFEERWEVMQAAEEYGSLPAYYETSEQEREKVSSLVAERLGKPTEEITAKDWERADTSAKIGSLVSVAFDTGLIPIEVGRAKVDWYKPDRNLLEITNEDAGKDRPTTELPLSDRAGRLISEWIQERRHLEKYDGTRLLWLNRDGNPYDSKNLCYLLRRLCEEVGIDHEDRKIVWYSLRHNMGQSITEASDLSEAHDQLRHDNIETTKGIYGPSTIESRRYTMDKINEMAKKTAEDPNFNPYADNPEQSISGAGSTPSGSVSSGTKHINVHINNTMEGRSELAQDLLSGDL